MSKKITLGKVVMTPKGRWSTGIQYEKLDAVVHEGSMWIAVSENIDQTPSEESEYWRIALEGIEEEETEESGIVAFLPDKIYVSPGVTLEIYNAQVCLDADRYTFKWTCPIGSIYSRKFSVTPASSQQGTYPLALDIIDVSGETVWHKDATLLVKQFNITGRKQVTVIGSRHADDRAWIEEINKNLCSNQQYRFKGTLGEKDGCYHEGRTGWTTETYLTQAQAYNMDTQTLVTNGFWDGERFNWQHWIDENAQYAQAVVLFFGEEELLFFDAETVANNLLQMISSIRQDQGTSFPIFVVLPPCPGTQEGMAQLDHYTYEYEYFKGKTKYEINKLFIEGAKKIYDIISASSDNKIYFIPLTQCFDSENNYPTAEIAVNPRSTETKKVQSNPLRPTDEGYKQMADVIFSTLSTHFS